MNKEDTLKSLKKYLEYKKDSNDSELIKTIEERIKKLEDNEIVQK